MKVKTLRRHDNTYGDTYTKNPGKVYEHPSPKVLIDSGYLEAADGTDGAGRGASGSGSSAGGTAQIDSKGNAAKGAQKAG